MTERDDFRLRCMHLALDKITSDNNRLEWETGRLFNLEMIRQMRISFEHYEKWASKERADG
jgi:hypothetical protein